MNGIPALISILAVLFGIFCLQKVIEFLEGIIKMMLWIIAIIAIGGIVLSAII